MVRKCLEGPQPEEDGDSSKIHEKALKCRRMIYKVKEKNLGIIRSPNSASGVID